jgi:aminobenzoyl-glutamate transport protein
MLERIERIGIALPDPATLFLIGALAVMALSQLAVTLDWSVEKSVTREVVDPATGAVRRESAQEVVRPVGLLSSDGLYWCLSSLVENFKSFPPLGIVLVGMLGIGLAERSGLIGAALRAVLVAVPPSLLTPAVLFVGVNSSLAVDAGYVLLPPVVMALYRAAGRSPLVGLAAVFAGVAGGFGANLSLTALDPMLAGMTEAGARIVSPDHAVAVTANLRFMQVSTLLLVAVGWALTAWWIEPRWSGRDLGPSQATSDESTGALTPDERRGLAWAGLAALATFAVMVAAVWIPGAPLHGVDGRFPRWVAASVPLVFIGFFVPGLVYGVATGSLRSDRDVARALADTMAGMGPYIVLAFFAAQFVEYFRHSGLGEMLALSGGRALARAALPAGLLMVTFIGVTLVMNLAMGSMSAKYAFFAPVFVPMFMQAGISPELTQAAYRIGDSVTNTVTPLNPYVVVVLMFMRRYAPQAGIGTLVALMLPFALVFAVAWTALLLVWMSLGLDLGPGGPLTYVP